MATSFSPCKGSYVLNQFPSNVMFGMNGFQVSASGAIQGHHGPLVYISVITEDIYLKLVIYVHYAKNNQYYQERQLKIPFFQNYAPLST